MMKENSCKKRREQGTESDSLLCWLIDTTTQTVINTEMVVLAQELSRNQIFLSNRLLTLEDATLTDLVNLEKFSEAFIRGWKVWKRGKKEEAMQTFCANMTDNVVSN